MMVGVFGDFRSARINDNEGFALHGVLLELRTGDRMSFGWIRTDNQNAIGIFQIGNRIRRCACTKGTLHPNRSRRMANTRTTVNIIRANYRTDKFLHQIIFLIRTTRRRNPCNRIRTVLLANTENAIHDVIISLIPSGGFKCTVSFNQRRFQSIRMLVKCKGVASFQTGMPGIHFRIVRRLNAQDLVVCDFHFQIATHAAVGTHGAYFFLGNDGFGLVNIGNR